MLAIFKKWKLLIIGGIILVILAYTLDPIVEFTLKKFKRSADSQVRIYPHWRYFTNRQDGYVIEFPSKPFKYHNNEIISNPAVISFHQFASVLDSNNCFLVTSLTESITNNFTDEQINFILDTSVKGILEADGKLLIKRNIILGTNFGREIEFQKSNQFFIKMRCYKVGHKFHELTVLGPITNQSASLSTNTSYFFNSFSLISK